MLKKKVKIVSCFAIVVGVILLTMLILPAMDDDVLDIFPHRLKISQEKITDDVSSHVDWIKDLKTKKMVYIQMTTMDLHGSLTRNPQKMNQIRNALLYSRKLETSIQWKLETCVRIIFEDESAARFLCAISNRYKVIYGKGWASYDLYNLIVQNGDYDWDFFEEIPKKHSLETEK